VLLPFQRSALRSSRPRFSPAVSPDHTPGSFSLWLDAWDRRTFSGASKVTSLLDKSAAARHLSEASATAPTWSALAANGLPGFVFDGTQRLRRSEAWMYASGAATVIALVSCPVPAANDTLISEGWSGGNTPLYAPIRCHSTASTCTSLITSDASGNTLGTASVLSASAFVSTPTIITRIDSGSNMAGRLNGAAGTNADYTRATTTLNLFCLGAESQGGPSSHWEGVIHELLVISGRVPLLAEVEVWEGYMAHKAGIA
jgi:hypothetical protein